MDKYKNRRPNDLLLTLPQDDVAELLLELGPRGRGLLRDSITHPYHGLLSRCKGNTFSQNNNTTSPPPIPSDLLKASCDAAEAFLAQGAGAGEIDADESVVAVDRPVAWTDFFIADQVAYNLGGTLPEG